MREIDVTQLETALAQGAFLMDVREPAEFAQVRVPGAASIPMSQLAARITELDRTTTTHVICASGNRSARMTEVLAGAGYDAVNVSGGTAAWLESGRPSDSGPAGGPA